MNRVLAGILLVAACASCAVAAEAVLPESFAGLAAPRVLVLADRPDWQRWAERFRLVTRTEVTFAALAYGDLESHHLCDKPLEETAAQREAMQAAADGYVDAQLARLDSFQVVIARLPVATRDEAANARLQGMLSRLAAYANAGGALVFINAGWEVVLDQTPLAAAIPVRFDGRHKAWTTGCQGSTDHPLTAGLPFEITGSHWYGPVYLPADESCIPLTRNEKQARFWYRRLAGGGQAVHLYQDSGGRSPWNKGSYENYSGDRPDDSEVWDAFHQRLAWWLVHGDRAIPVTTRLVTPEQAVAGEPLAVTVELRNQLDRPQTVAVTLTLSGRRSAERIVTPPQTVELAANEQRQLAFAPTVDLPGGDGWLRLDAGTTAGGAGQAGASTFLPYRHRLPLTLTVTPAVSRSGERVTATAAWEAGPADLTFTLGDRHGRALASETRRFEAGPATVSFTMPDGGPEAAGSYWVTVLARDGAGQVLGSARQSVLLDDPWEMRRRFEWSVWSWGGGGDYLKLLQDAGFNALGMQGNDRTADRFGLRQYVEGTGIDTFGVKIEQDNWAATREVMEKRLAKLNEGTLAARTVSLVSLGEESGFDTGWGKRYYWKEDQAPPVAQAMFGQYLAELYGDDLAALNAEWGSAYGAFTEIPLERDRVRSPGRVFVASQYWEALQQKGETDRLPVELKAIDPAQTYLAHAAPYLETYRFFDWYYQRYCDLATETWRARRNPVPRTIMSAPGGFYPKVDVHNFDGLGPFYPKETGLVRNAVARRDYGDVPGFSGAMWAYFDLRPLWSAVVMSHLIAGNTHVDYWVDFPLTFNTDLTHTRASFWTKELRRQWRAVEPVLLHKRIAPTDGLAMYIPPQPLDKGVTGKHFGAAISGNAVVYSALEETGYLPRVAGLEELAGIRVLVASYAQVVSPAEGRQLREFVEAGGTLICTPWLASCSPHGNMRTVYPSPESGLAELLGFQLLNTSQEPGKEAVGAEVFGRRFELLSKGRDEVRDLAADVRVLARYADGQPLLLERPAGKGRVLYLNLVYDWSGWWKSFHEPSREAYRQLFAAMLSASGCEPAYTIAFAAATPTAAAKGWWGMSMESLPEPGESVPWWASQLYTDPSGRIAYLGVFSDHRSPVIDARVRWASPGAAIRDLLTGQPVEVRDGAASLTLGPGEASWWAIAAGEVPPLQVAVPAKLAAGEPLTIEVACPGNLAHRGFVVDAVDPEGEPAPALSPSNLALPGERQRFAIRTALNERPGIWQVTVTDSLTRQAHRREVQIVAAAPVAPELLAPFTPRADDTLPPERLTDEEFLALLGQLREIYLGEQAGIEAKYMLSYYLNVPYRPENRHAVARRLQRADWEPHLPALAERLEAGESYLLLGEDLGRDPSSGLAIDPWAAGQIEAALRRLPAVQVSESGRWTVYRVGRGKVIAGAASVDRAAYHSIDFAAWHEQVKADLAGQVPELARRAE